MSLGGSSSSLTAARKGSGWVVLVLGALVVVNLYVFVWDKDTSVGAIRREAEAKTVPAAALPSTPLVTLPLAAGSGAAAPVGPPGSIDGKVGRSDTLGRLLKKSGLAAAEADEVIRALSGVLDFKAIRAGQAFHIERGPDGRVRLFELVVSKVSKVRAERATTGELVGKADQSQTRIDSKTIGGKIDSSLYAALKASGETPALVDFFVDVFAYDLDFYNDTHAGDTFRVVWRRTPRERRVSPLQAHPRGRVPGQGRDVSHVLLRARRWGGRLLRSGRAIVREDPAEDAAQVHARVVRLRSQAYAPRAAHRAGAPRHRLCRPDRHPGVGRRSRDHHAARDVGGCRQRRHDSP
ncbi:MAG: hypothetical protein WKG01_06860 [Kofleriaceae bacterium]